MKRIFVILVLAVAWAVQSPAQEKAPLRLAQTVSVPGMARKWDDFGVDLKGHRLFVTSAVTVVEQQGADDYRVIATIPTKPGAKTARLAPELNRYYVGVPAKDKQEAQILVFEVAP